MCLVIRPGKKEKRAVTGRMTSDTRAVVLACFWQSSAIIDRKGPQHGGITESASIKVALCDLQDKLDSKVYTSFNPDVCT